MRARRVHAEVGRLVSISARLVKGRSVALLSLGLIACSGYPGGTGWGGAGSVDFGGSVGFGGASGSHAGGAAPSSGGTNGAGPGEGGAPELAGGTAGASSSSGGKATGGTETTSGGAPDTAYGGSGGSGTESGGAAATGGATNGGSTNGGSTNGGSDGGTSSSAGGTTPIEAGAAGQGGEVSEPVVPLDDPRIEWLGACSPLDLSADATTVLAQEGLWDREHGWVSLPARPVALSADGRVVFLQSDDQIYRFTREGGAEALGGFSDLMSIHVGGTVADGSRFVACAWDSTMGVGVLIDWTLSDRSFHVIPVEPYYADVICDGGGSAISADGRTVVADRGEFGLFISTTAPSLSYTNPSQSWKSPFLEAISGNGEVISFGCPRSPALCTAVSPELYLLPLIADDEECAYSSGSCSRWSEMMDLNFDGTAGVGRQIVLHWFPQQPPPPTSAVFYWTPQDGNRHVVDVFAARGFLLDTTPQSPLSISDDGRTVLGVGTRHFSDGTSLDECFLATLGELPPITTLPPIPTNCGNGVLDGGEACDDGNDNNGDTCSTRCQRPTLSVVDDETCAADATGFKCWGQGREVAGGDSAWVATSPVSDLGAVAQWALGADHSCAVLESGAVRCWGEHALGRDDTAASATPVEVEDIDSAIQVSVGFRHSCALLRDRTVRCWGDNAFNQLGTADGAASTKPIAVPSLIDVVQITAHDDYTCALQADGSSWCWGFVVSATMLTEPTPIPALANARQLTSSQYSVVALTSAGEIHQFRGGLDNTPIFGDGNSTSDIVQIAIADSDRALSHWCAVHADGTVNCKVTAGYTKAPNYPLIRSQLSDTNRIPNIHDAVEIATDGDHACLRRATGEILCWGIQTKNELGIGPLLTNYPNSVGVPVAVREFPPGSGAQW